MKKTIMMVLVVLLALSPTVSFAAKDRKGASDQALEHANENAIFNRVGDWFATIGKSDEEKAQIKAERKAKRAAKRAEKEVKKKAKEAQEVKDKKVKEAEEKTKKAKKNLDKKLNRGR